MTEKDHRRLRSKKVIAEDGRPRLGIQKMALAIGRHILIIHHRYLDLIH